MEHSSSSQHIGINQAAQVVCVHTPVDGQRKSFDQVERLAIFYGLDMPTFEVGAESDTAAIWAALRQKRTVAAILTAEALAVVDRRQLIAASLKDGSESIPLLIVNLSAETAPELLMQWTDHAVTRCDGPGNDRCEQYVFGRDGEGCHTATFWSIVHPQGRSHVHAPCGFLEDPVSN